MNWEFFDKCILCESKNFIIFKRDRPNVKLSELNKNTIIYYYICNDCGLIFQNPHLDAESLNEYYSTDKYRSSVLTPQDSMDTGELDRQKRISEFVLLGTHLDVGCSRGYLLQLTSDKGCRVMGVEPNSNYVLKNIPFVTSLDSISEEYDTVTCIHVLEHVLNPIIFMNKLIKCTKKRLIIEVPGENSKGGPWRLPHIYFFTKDVVVKMCSGLALKQFIATPHSFFIFEKSV
jgi:hypothetical protein